MKLKFKQQAYQTRAVEAVVDCFKGQPNTVGLSYRIDPGKIQQQRLDDETGFKNAGIMLSLQQLLDNIQQVQRQQNLPQSQSLTEYKTLKKGGFVVDKT